MDRRQVQEFFCVLCGVFKTCLDLKIHVLQVCMEQVDTIIDLYYLWRFDQSDI